MKCIVFGVSDGRSAAVEMKKNQVIRQMEKMKIDFFFRVIGVSRADFFEHILKEIKLNFQDLT